MSTIESMRRRNIYSQGLVVPSWLSQSLWYGLIGVFAVFILTIIIFTIRIVREWDQRAWFGEEPYRVLLIQGSGNSASKYGLLTIWPDTKKAALLELPAELRIQATGGYGMNRIAALSELGKIEHVNNKLLQDSVSTTFGIPIHTIVYVKLMKDPIFSIQKQITIQAIKAKSSLAETIDILKLLQGISAPSITQLSLSQANAVKQNIEADGSTSTLLEPALLDRLMQEKLAGIWPAAANLQVAIINATNKPTMATQWSRPFRFSGFDVVSVTDQQEIQEQTTILTNRSQMKSLEIKILHQLMPWAKLSIGDTSKYRGDVAVIIGLDSWKWLSDREFYLKN